MTAIKPACAIKVARCADVQKPARTLVNFACIAPALLQHPISCTSKSNNRSVPSPTAMDAMAMEVMAMDVTAMEVTMKGKTIWRSIRVAALAAAVALALGSLAWGADDHDYDSRHDEAREHGYQNGYRDGQRQAQYDVQSGRRFKFKTDDWEDSRGFEHWMGSKGRYKQAYREGYERAYRQTFGYPGDRYRDRDDYRHYDRDWR